MQYYKRGFFCSDLSLRHPYRECTITVPMLLVCMLMLPVLFILVVEIMRICKHFRMRQYVVNAWRSLATFSFGFIVTYLTTEVAKNAIGRLRPHFYVACQPRMPDGSDSCPERLDGAADLDRAAPNLAWTLYIEQYYCSNRNLSSSQIRELHVSFPSAHSSLSFYAMLFLAFYVHAIWKGGRGGICRVLKHILQFLFLLLAWYISLSRVADYWHHWSDVLAGGIMGVIYAVLTAVYVGGLLDGRQQKSSQQQLQAKLQKRQPYNCYEKPQRDSVGLKGLNRQQLQKEHLMQALTLTQGGNTNSSDSHGGLSAITGASDLVSVVSSSEANFMSAKGGVGNTAHNELDNWKAQAILTA